MGLFKTFKVFKHNVSEYKCEYELLKLFYQKFYKYKSLKIKNYYIKYNKEKLIGILKYNFFGNIRNNQFFFFFDKFIQDKNYFNIFNLKNLHLKKSLAKLNRYGTDFKHIYDAIYRILLKFPFLITIKPKTIIILNLLNYNKYIFEWKDYEIIINNIKIIEKEILQFSVISKNKFIKILDIKNINFSNYYLYYNIIFYNYKILYYNINNNLYIILHNIKILLIKWNFFKYIKNIKYNKKINEDFFFFKLIKEEEKEILFRIFINNFKNLKKNDEYCNYIEILDYYSNKKNINENRENIIQLLVKLYQLKDDITCNLLKKENKKNTFFYIQFYLKKSKYIFKNIFFSRLYILYFFWYIYKFNKIFYFINNIFSNLWCRFYYFFNNSYNLENNKIFYKYLYLYININIYIYLEFENKWKVYYKHIIDFSWLKDINLNLNLFINYYFTFFKNDKKFKNLINIFYNKYLNNVNYYNIYNLHYLNISNKFNYLSDLIYKKNYNIKIHYDYYFNILWKVNSIKDISYYNNDIIYNDKNKININIDILNNKIITNYYLKTFYNEKPLLSNFLFDKKYKTDIYTDNNDEIFKIKYNKIFYL